MRLAGLKDLLSFVNYLGKARIWYRLEHLRDDALMVSIHMVGMRMEVEFFDDHVEFTTFSGDESVDRDQGRLFAMLDEGSK